MKSDSKDSFAFHYNLGMASFEKGDYRAAIKHFERSIRINPNVARTHNELGMCYLFLKENDKAVPHFERALEIDPSFAEAHNNIGISLFGLGRFTEAEQHFQATLSSPEYGTKFIPLFNLGNLYHNQERYADAIAIYERALEDEEKITAEYRINIHLQLGNSLLAVNRYRDAYQHYELVLVLNPRLVEAAFNAGVAAFNYGDFDTARTMFSKVITVAPVSDWAERSKEYLSKLEQ